MLTLGKNKKSPKSVDPVFEWFSTVTAPAPSSQSVAGFANIRDQSTCPGLSSGQAGFSQRQVVGLGEDVSGSGVPGEFGGSNGEVPFGMPADSQGLHPPSFNSKGSTGHGFLENHAGVVVWFGDRVPSVAPCLLDASPPKWGGPLVGPVLYSYPETNALTARPQYPASFPAEALREGLRGVRLAM